MGGSECFGEGEVPVCEERTFTAHCRNSKPEALVDVWFVNGQALVLGEDGAEIPDCCHPDEPSLLGQGTVRYTFVLSCASKCEEGRGDEEHSTTITTTPTTTTPTTTTSTLPPWRPPLIARGFDFEPAPTSGIDLES